MLIPHQSESEAVYTDACNASRRTYGRVVSVQRTRPLTSSTQMKLCALVSQGAHTRSSMLTRRSVAERKQRVKVIALQGSSAKSITGVLLFLIFSNACILFESIKSL